MDSQETNNTAPEKIEIIDVEDFNYDGYEVVRGEFFAHINEPCFVFNDNKVYVNTACVRRLPDTEFVQILVNPENKILAVRPCDETEKDSFRWRSNTGKIKPKQISCRIFFAKVYTLMGWDMSYRYKLLGKLVRSDEEMLFVFDLKSPEIFVRKEVDGKIRRARAPVYPEEWKNHFGIPVKEHQAKLQVNIYNGYAVFGIQREDENG